MGKHILVALLGGLLVVGVSAAFAEEPQLTDQEVLQAWGQTQIEVEQITEGKRGLNLLTDEELDQINAAGILDSVTHHFGFGNIGSLNFGETSYGSLHTRNVGDTNTGFGNAGNINTGFGNAGNINTGFGNVGDTNIGFRNTGDFNTGDTNAGAFISGTSNYGIRFFPE